MARQRLYHCSRLTGLYLKQCVAVRSAQGYVVCLMSAPASSPFIAVSRSRPLTISSIVPRRNGLPSITCLFSMRQPVSDSISRRLSSCRHSIEIDRYSAQDRDAGWKVHLMETGIFGRVDDLILPVLLMEPKGCKVGREYDQIA